MTFILSSDLAGSSSSPQSLPSASACWPSAPKSSATCSETADATIEPLARFVAEMHGFERMLRGAYAAGGRLQTAAVEAQASEGLSPVAGHQVLAAITAAQVAIADALSHSAGGHKLVERLGKSLGYDVVGYGDGTKPPEPGPGLLPRPLGSLVDTTA